MNLEALRRFVLARQGFATVLQGHLVRLWGRDLTDEESRTVRNYTMCGSFMSLESIERGLSLTSDPERAESEFSFMKAEVSKYSGNVVQEVKKRLGLSTGAPDPSAALIRRVP